MESISNQKSKEGEKVDFFEVIVEIYAWLEIIVAAQIVGLIIGFGVYYSKPDKSRLPYAIAIVVLGFVIGLILAIISWKKRHATHINLNSSDNIAISYKKEE